MVKIKGMIKKYGLLIVACLMLVTCVLSGTMAKYKSSSPAEGLKVTVAQWGVTVGGDDNKIGDAISLVGVEWMIEDNGFDHELINADDGAGIIAPGTWGYAAVEITNIGDVTAIVTIEEDSDTPFLPTDTKTDGLVFGLALGEGGEPSAPPDDGSDPEWKDKSIADLDLGSFSLASGESKIIYVCYAWDLGAGTNDAQDTPLGKEELEEDRTFTFGTLTFTAVQVDA